MDGQTPPNSNEQHRVLLIILFVGFVLSGIATVIVGPMLPIFKERWALNDSQLGLFPAVQFLAALVGTLGSSAISSLWGYRPALVIGYALTGTGLAGLNADSRMLAMVACGAFGLGYGLLTAPTNLFVAELGGVKSASLLNRLNFMWGAGAMSCSPLISFALGFHKLPLLLAGYAAFGGVMALLFLFAKIVHESHGVAATRRPPQPGASGFAVTAAMCLLFFLYVATETGIGGWAAEFAKRLAGQITGLTTLTPMFFYAGLALGRGTAPVFLKRYSERTVVLSALTLTALGTALVVKSGGIWFAVVAFFLAGFGCASIYPIYISWLSKWYGDSAKKVGGLLFSLASLGGSAGPLAVGVISTRSGSLRVGLLAPLVAAAVMFALVVSLGRRTVN
jgi:MFS transporter, FHS family, glucose/mannose:H+ symporter